MIIVAQNEKKKKELTRGRREKMKHKKFVWHVKIPHIGC